MKIVLVDTNESFMSKLETPLESAGFDCEKLVLKKKNADAFFGMLPQELTGLVILGEGVSDKLRSSLTEHIRGSSFLCPVLSVVHSEAFETIFNGKVSDVSDFICLPVRSRELVTRVGILIRRAYPDIYESQVLRHGTYVFSCYPNRVSFRGKDIALSAKEYHLGRLFFEHIGKPLSRMTLSETIWNSEEDELSRTIDTHVSRVRNKLGLNEKNGFSLKQVYGFGYQLMAL